MRACRMGREVKKPAISEMTGRWSEVERSHPVVPLDGGRAVTVCIRSGPNRTPSRRSPSPEHDEGPASGGAFEVVSVARSETIILSSLPALFHSLDE